MRLGFDFVVYIAYHALVGRQLEWVAAQVLASIASPGVSCFDVSAGVFPRRCVKEEDGGCVRVGRMATRVDVCVLLRCNPRM